MLMGATFAFVPLSIIASCSSNSSISKNYVSTDIGGLREEFNPDVPADQANINQKLVDKVKSIKESTKEEDKRKKELLNEKTILITTGGKANDKSFNQSV